MLKIFFFQLKFSVFTTERNLSILHGQVFLMHKAGSMVMIFEYNPLHQKTNNLHMRNQNGRRSAL